MTDDIGYNVTFKPTINLGFALQYSFLPPISLPLTSSCCSLLEKDVITQQNVNPDLTGGEKFLKTCRIFK